MSGGKLEVQIGADKADFDKKLKEIEFDIKELSKVKLDKLKVGLDVSEINAQIKDAKNSLKSLQTTVKDTGSSFVGMAPKVANGGNALMQFSRIAQDAPYGIIGIGNNITATVEAFGYLKQSTGSTGGALKALGSSILGSGGILLGVSLLTTGLTYLAQSGLSLSDVWKKLIGETDVFADELKKVNEEAYNDTGVQKVIADVNQLTTEIQLAKDGFIDKDKVVAHYNETMGKTTGIVKTLDEVEQQLVKNGDAYIKMTLYKAAANIALEDAAKSLLKAEQSRNKKLSEFKSDFADVQFGVLTKSGQDALEEKFLKRQEVRKQKEIALNKETANASLAIAKKFQEDAAKISKEFNFNFFGDNKVADTPKAKKPVVAKVQFKADNINRDINLLENEIRYKYFSPLMQMNIIPDDAAVKAGIKLQAIKDALIQFNTDAQNIIQNGIVNTFAGFGSAIGNALANGTNILEGVGKSLLSSLGTILTQMGEMAISVGIGLLGIKAALKTLNPAVAIGAGVALIALGSFFSAKSSSIGGGIGGGSGASSSSGAGANNGSFTSSGFGGGSGGGTVVFEIAGQKLIGVLNNTINGNKRLGGTIGLG